MDYIIYQLQLRECDCSLGTTVDELLCSCGNDSVSLVSLVAVYKWQGLVGSTLLPQ